MWKDINGYEGIYQINEDGQVKSISRIKGAIKCKEKILKYDNSSAGYKRVILSKNDIKQRFLVHRLVYKTFIGELPEGFCINHVDHDKSNNNIANLEIVTTTENNRLKTNTKLTKGKVKAIRASSLSIKELSKLYDISPRTVLHVKNKTRWSEI